tara:strand:+ start:57 stop:461 length:405 start_codon:yes stop_codon:yes gene_type:complete
MKKLTQKEMHESLLAIQLFNAVQSLLTITEGEDLDSDSQRLIHFDALCMRINQICEQYQSKIQRVRDVMLSVDSATTQSKPEPSGYIQILVNKDEYSLMVEALEHMANALRDFKDSDKFQELANDIKDLKKEVS